MAITLDELQAHPTGFVNNGYSADWSGTEELVPAIAAKSIVVEMIAISCIAAITLTIGAGETGGAVTNEVFGPIQFAATSQFICMKLPRPIKLATATSLVVDASGAGAACVIAAGYYE